MAADLYEEASWGHRADRLAAGRWAELVREATQHQSARGSRGKRSSNVVARQLKHECNGRGQVSRTRQELVGAKLAAKDKTTLNELQGRRPQEQLREIPANGMSFEPEIAVQLHRTIFATFLRGSPSGSSPGLGGCTNEMLRVLLDDPEALLLTAAAVDFARTDVPQCIFGAFMLATMTALQQR